MATLTSECIDERILEKISGKEPFFVAVILREDLFRKNPAFLQRWDEVYRREPSCKHIENETMYDDAMRDKYVRVYCACQDNLGG